jgi:hypothetical protein
VLTTVDPSGSRFHSSAMKPYLEIDLDERGFNYLLQHLRGVNPFCDELALLVEQMSGRVFTVAPVGTATERAHNFRAGGLLSENLDYSKAFSLGPGKGMLMPVVSLTHMRAKITLEALEKYPGSICICDDFNPEWSEKIAKTYPTAFGVGLQTYHLLTKENGADGIGRIFQDADTIWHGASAVCVQGLSTGPARDVSEELLRASAASAVEITSTAYDREGFVVWRRDL